MTQPRLTTVAQLLAAIPAVLGYVPADTGSFVVICMDSDHCGKAKIKLVTRCTSEEAEAVASTSITRAIANNGINAVIVVTVAAPHLKSQAITEHMLALHALTRTVEVIGSFYLPTLADATTGEDLDSGDVLHVDPYASEVAAASVADGKPVERHRDTIGVRYQQGEHITSAPHADPARVLEELAAVIYADETPDTDLISRTAAVILDIPVRDAMFRLALYGRTSAWTTMTTIARHTRGTARVHALTLAGWLAYTLGRGPDAGSAFEAAHAEAAATGSAATTMLLMFDTALTSGVEPTVVSGIATSFTVDEVYAATGAHLPGVPDRN